MYSVTMLYKERSNKKNPSEYVHSLFIIDQQTKGMVLAKALAPAYGKGAQESQQTHKKA